jgi:hypothetical protein
MLSQLEIPSPWTEIVPERKFDEACFLKFSPCFSVKFFHFGEHFFLKTPRSYVYVCLLLDLLISFHSNRQFTRKLHCLHQLIRTPLLSPSQYTLLRTPFPLWDRTGVCKSVWNTYFRSKYMLKFTGKKYVRKINRP